MRTSTKVTRLTKKYRTLRNKVERANERLSKSTPSERTLKRQARMARAAYEARQQLIELGVLLSGQDVVEAPRRVMRRRSRTDVASFGSAVKQEVAA